MSREIEHDGEDDPRPIGSRGLRIGRVWGIEIVLDASLVIVFVLIAASLATGVLRQWHPDWDAPLTWAVAVGGAVLFIGSVLLHELSHVAVARSRGMQVSGITLFMFGGMARIESEAKTPGDEFWMAAVGPLTSIAIGLLALVSGTLLLAVDAGAIVADAEQAMRGLGPAGTLLLWLGPVNLMLAAFNLVPAFPLDGGRILRAALWGITGSITRATSYAVTLGRFFAWFLIAAGTFMAFGVRFPFLGGGLLQGVWLVLIGWILDQGARAGLAQITMSRALAGVPVRDLMLSDLETVPRTATVGDLVRNYMTRSEQRCFPVTDPEAGDEFIGLVCMADVRGHLPTEWDRLPVSDVMTPRDVIDAVHVDDDATRAMKELARRDVDQLVVLDSGQVVGLFRRRDIVKWLSLTTGGPPEGRPRYGEPPAHGHATRHA